MAQASDWRGEYKRRLQSADEAVSRLQDGQRLILPTLAGQPPGLIAAMGRRLRDGKLARVRAGTILPCPCLADALLRPEHSDSVDWDSLFCGTSDRLGVFEGRYDMTPIHFGQMPKVMRNDMKVGAVMTLVSPPDAEGYMSIGISIDYTKALIGSASFSAVEVNPNVPRVFGDCLVHVSEVDAIVESDDEIFELPNPPGTPEDEKIGALIAERIPDGATIQLGYGAAPSAVGLCLRGHSHLGIHTEMFVDAMRVLMQEGVVDNSRKSINPGKTLYTFAAGTRQTYDFLHENPAVEGHPVEHTNDLFVIAQHKGMVAINATIAVDLTGQACSESIGGMQYSGTGGQADFVRGAMLAEGGRSFLATHATAKGGTVSCIVGGLAPGSVVTTARADMDMMVTEFGVAELRGRSLSERAQALIKIAHPKFRDGLQEEAAKRGLSAKRAVSSAAN
ncbi:MAG: acetyl-CoA hydrolase/transferase C-terminal domain-containing protein [Alphaproteobacteria bacterium]|jgi:acyl-CoA hydrolase|nr:acetyl-CoA hydrolase/transferase C-terminal domain-containing protein [Alphaproteobacteria bacterium]MDP6819006.1 acetyl-CoA hydrolase/transferase C-terminal domain-containing protein [Alphaproteobacteria bacterium]|tara:strand:- start:109 stop:1455 length:1347 start_codon:yes stop_codon:yes gene_type:complete